MGTGIPNAGPLRAAYSGSQVLGLVGALTAPTSREGRTAETPSLQAASLAATGEKTRRSSTSTDLPHPSVGSPRFPTGYLFTLSYEYAR